MKFKLVTPITAEYPAQVGTGEEIPVNVSVEVARITEGLIEPSLGWYVDFYINDSSNPISEYMLPTTSKGIIIKNFKLHSHMVAGTYGFKVKVKAHKV